MEGDLSTPCFIRCIMRRDAQLLPPHPHAGPALVPAAPLAAGRLAHPALEEMVQGGGWPWLPNAMGCDVEWPGRGDPTLG
jgi:hypothetical protein